MEELAPKIVEDKPEIPHDDLVNYISHKHYGDKDKEIIAKNLLENKDLFDKALREIHKDEYHDEPYDQFSKKYYSAYGNPFPEKKNSTQNSGSSQEASLKENGGQSGPGSQSGFGDSLLNYVLSRIPKGSADKEVKAKQGFDLEAMKKQLATLPSGEQEMEKKIQQDNAQAQQQLLQDEKLAIEADKSGQDLFKNSKGEIKSTDDFLEDNDTLDAFEKNFHNGIINVMEGPQVLLKSVNDLAYGAPNLNSLLMEESIKDKEESKMYTTRSSDKNILDNPSDPRAYAALGGQLTSVAVTALLTAGVGNAANLSSQGALGLQAMNSLSYTAPDVYMNAKNSGLSDNGAAAMTLVTSPAIAALDMVGLSKLLNNDATRSLVTKTGLEAIQEVTENFTKKFTPELARKASSLVSAKVPELVKNITKKGLAEGVTETAQEGIAVGSEAIYNEYFKDKDEAGYNLDGWQKRMVLAGASGLVGGGAFGVLPNTPSPQVQELTKVKDKLTNDLNNPDLTESAKEVINEHIKEADAQIQEQVQLEQKAQEEEKARQEQIAALDSQKQDLSNNLANHELSPESKSIIEDKIKEIDSQIEEINPTVEGLNSKRAEILASLEIDKKSGEPIITPEAQKQLDDIDNQIISLNKTVQKNEIAKEQTAEPTVTEQETKTETPAVQEGQQLEEKPIEETAKLSDASKKYIATYNERSDNKISEQEAETLGEAVAKFKGDDKIDLVHVAEGIQLAKAKPEAVSQFINDIIGVNKENKDDAIKKISEVVEVGVSPKETIDEANKLLNINSLIEEAKLTPAQSTILNTVVEKEALSSDNVIGILNEFNNSNEKDTVSLAKIIQEYATKKRIIGQDSELEHQRTETLGLPGEAINSNSNEQSGEKQQEEGQNQEQQQQEVVPSVEVGKEIVEPPVPPEEKPTAEKEPPKKKKLKVAERILESEMVSDEVKEGLIKKGIHYIPHSNEVTVADAKAIIENHGKEKAFNMVMNTSNEMKDLARGSVARQLFETYSNDAKTAETESERMENLNKSVEIASFAAKMFKDAGQTVQSAKMWKRMLQKTPEGMLIAIEKDYSKQRDEALSAFTKELKDDKKSLDEFISENIDKILDSDIIKKAIDKIVKDKKGKARTKKDISDFFDGLKIKDDPGQVFESTYYIVKSAYNTAIEIIKKAVLAGVDVKEAVQRGIDSINAHPDQVGTWEEDKFRAEMTERINNAVEQKTDVNKEIKDIVSEVKRIVKEHYTDKEKTSEGLSEKLSNELGLPPETSQKIAEKVKEELEKSLKNQKSQLLSKLSKATNLNPTKKENLIKSIVKEIEQGPISTERFKELYAESIGVATLTSEQKAHILKLAGTVKAAEDFVDKYKAEYTPENRKKYEKLKFEASKAFDELSDLHGKKKDVWDTMATMMQGNLLTPLSLIKNIYSNAVMMPLRGTTKALTSAMDFLISQAGKTKVGSKYFDPKRTTDFLATQKGYAQGLWKGLKLGSKQFVHGVPNEDLANRELEAGFRPIKAWAKVVQDVKTKNITNKTISDFTYAFFGTAPELTFRALNFGDKPFSKAAYEAKAREIGELAGLKGKELEKFIEFPDEASMEKIKKHGEQATFQQNEGVNKWIQESISKLLNEIAKLPMVGKPAKLLLKTQMPFVKTPLNIISETIDYAVPPLSLMKGIYYLNKGEREQGLTFISKAMVGTIIAIVARQLFENGLLSPSSDDDEKVRAAQFEEMPPEGLNLSGFLRMLHGGSPKTQATDTWINYKNLGPLGIIFNTHANRLTDKKGSEEENKAISYVYDLFSSLPGIASSSLEQSFLAGTNTLLTAIKEGGQKLDKWIINTMMTLSNIAVPNTLATASRSANENMPDLRGDNFSDQFVNTIKSRYFQGGELPPKVTMWGEPVKQTPEGRNKFIYHFLDPTKNKELRNKEWSYKVYELYDQTGDKGALPSVPDRTITVKKKSIKLTSDQYNQLSTFVGRNRARLVRALVESGSWEKLDNEQKIQRLKKAYESGAKIGAREFKNKNK